ncbi:hypothetical protein KP509_02G065100 [Ceratopteris richardii]|uniref:Sigma factor n=2 Tax=Ceratopteris richardii TaxID=49495 RepID=A0A8T2VET7_CERRI|nr:hypothetical protein KP509_02G065100 [Ceratopteris richardii]
MGASGVGVMRDAVLIKDVVSHTDLNRRFSFIRRSNQVPSSCRPRRSFTTPLAVTKRPISVSRPNAPAYVEPSEVEILKSTFTPSSSAAPATGMEPQQFFQRSRRSDLSDVDNAVVDEDVNFKEAAAVLEQLFSESPSLECDCTSGTEAAKDQNPLFAPSSMSAADNMSRNKNLSPRTMQKRRRIDLKARIRLRRRKTVEVTGRSARRGTKKVSSDDLCDSIWSPAASELLREHGEVVNLAAQNWARLRGDLLSAEEERWLASLMSPAKALQKLKEKMQQQFNKDISNEEWALAAKMDTAILSRHLDLYQAARNKLVKMNLRLVKHQARKYEKEAAGSSLTVIELCQEGVKGLITAVDRFNPAKGVRFSTYAVFWIRNSIIRAQTRAGYTIRAPFNFAEIKMNINKAKWELRLEAGEAGTGEECLKEVLERAGIDEEKYKMVMRSSPRVVSLHKRDPLTGAELIERLADANSQHDVSSRYLVGPGGGIQLTDPLLRLGIDDVLDSLKPKESLVLRQRFGLDGKGERALGEIGRNMRISREMVRRYEARGLLKLKHPTRLAYLRSFLSQE